ncbi:hypothetical protein DM02DRAFT_684611 [Periconia macrospinosa]|uniref:Fungal calcium binding protein domain-containing protein n=1 Tax=Periconia macrospinosa TaxID=97972 RepID=A0A2V1DHF5_9PLEO|nr:hypothetical protein DM02DRAFT_684611 [Periconia macrospinosa]
MRFLAIFAAIFAVHTTAVPFNSSNNITQAASEVERKIEREGPPIFGYRCWLSQCLVELGKSSPICARVLRNSDGIDYDEALACIALWSNGVKLGYYTWPDHCSGCPDPNN